MDADSDTDSDTDRELDEALEAREIDIDAVVDVGRAGWVAKGVVYVMLGVITISIALSSNSQSSSGDTASQRGALAEIAEYPLGSIVLVAVAVGLLLFCLWRLTGVFLPGENDLETWAHRAGYLASAAIYGFLAYTAVRIVLDRGESSSSDGGAVERYSRQLVEHPVGRWLLGLGGLAAVAVGLLFLVKAFRREFMDRLDTSDLDDSKVTFLSHLGMVGWIGRGLTAALVGVFLISAAVAADRDNATGLDGALRDTADSWWGSGIVLVVGVALIAYGVFAAVSAPIRRLIGP